MTIGGVRLVEMQRDLATEAEGVGGPLTEFDSEESPLSKVQAATIRKQTEMVGFRLQKRTMQGVYDDVERPRLPCGR